MLLISGSDSGGREVVVVKAGPEGKPPFSGGDDLKAGRAGIFGSVAGVAGIGTRATNCGCSGAGVGVGVGVGLPQEGVAEGGLEAIPMQQGCNLTAPQLIAAGLSVTGLVDVAVAVESIFDA
jgi:hypothetical protein